jgi:hypothetical protein
MSNPKPMPKIGLGKRALIAGRTGSGKSTLGNWLLTRSPGHWIILNPKWTAGYNKLPGIVTVKYKGPADNIKIMEACAKHHFVNVEPTSTAADADTLDDLILWIHENYNYVGLCVDELYSLHNNGRAGPGLTGWLTRGRELKQSFIGLTQRPAWLSQFLFSESDYVGSMSLVLEKDRKRMVEMTGMSAFEQQQAPHYWMWYTVATHTLRRFGPVPLPAGLDK